jgi:hypothetical protein
MGKDCRKRNQKELLHFNVFNVQDLCLKGTELDQYHVEEEYYRTKHQISKPKESCLYNIISVMVGNNESLKVEPCRMQGYREA